MSVVIWHNPRCSKSLEALALIEARGLAPKIIDYRATPPSPAEIRAAAKTLGLSVRQMIRTKEEAYSRLGLDDPSLDEARLSVLLSENPVLIERPIVFSKGRAAIGRPPEAILAILDR